MAIPFMVAAHAYGVPRHYIESAARSEGPSLTGKVVQRIPGTQSYTQYASWSSRAWSYRGSLFDPYFADQSASVVPSPSRVVVTLGTMGYGFRRAVDAVLSVLREVAASDADVLWQVGATNTHDLPIAVSRTIPAKEMRAAIRDADLVIAHAGIGSSLTALDSGKCPVLLPRSRGYGEHIDDHQILIARELAHRRLAVVSDPSELAPEHIIRAMGARVSSEHIPARFRLDC